jgi:hypothetical protein
MTRVARPAAWVLVALTVAAGLTACASVQVGSYAARGVQIRQYRTIAWGPAEARSTGDPRLDSNRFFEERIRAQVEKGLAARGFAVTTANPPDLLVHYHASVTQEIDVRELDRPYGYCDAADCAPYVYDAGTIFVDLVDPRTNTLVWRGWAEGSLDGVIDDQAWLERRIDEVVARILGRLPSGLSR